MSGLARLLALLGCGLYAVGVYAAWTTCLGPEASRTRGASTRWRAAAALVGATLVRLALAATTEGYPPDVGTFSAWAAHAAEGLTSFYAPGYFADYPPGYLYVLWAIGELRLLLGLDFGSPGFLLLLKLPAVLADVAAAALLYRLGLRWRPDAALALGALYAFNPAVILDSAVWGQVDAVLLLLLFLGVLGMGERPGRSGAWFAAALLVKPQALVFAPVPLLWFGLRAVRSPGRATAADALVFGGSAVLVFSLGVLPFAAGEPLGWIVGKYGGTLASYPYATLNAFNLFALVGGNLASVGERLLGLPYAAWGGLFLALICLFCAGVAWGGRDLERFWYLCLFLAASVFVLSAKMHERYLFPAPAFALAFYATSRDPRALVLYAGFTATLFLNTAEVLALGLREVYAVPRFDPLLLGASLANVLLGAMLAWTGWDRYVGKKPRPLSPPWSTAGSPPPPPPRLPRDAPRPDGS